MASTLEQFVSGARSLTTAGSIPQLCEYLKKCGDLLQKNLGNLDSVLQTLRLDQHTLPILAILSVRFNQSTIPDLEPLLMQFLEFVNGANLEHLQAAPDSFAELCHAVTRLLVERGLPIRGLQPLSLAIQKLQAHPNQLTSVHADLVQLCLLAQCPWPARRYLDVEITEIQKEGSSYFDVKYLLLYYYYGGLLYGSLKMYEEALHFFEACVTAPALVVSHIMLEAHRKHLLMSLLVRGELRPFPKYTSQVVGRFFKPLSQVYYDMAQAFTDLNTRDFRHLMTIHQDVFVRDKNMGLVKQCLVALERRRVARLTSTFVSLSLRDVAQKAGLESPSDAEWCVLKMILDGQISAKINQRDGVVEFVSPKEDSQMVEMTVSRVMGLDAKIRRLEEVIMLDPAFIQKTTGAAEPEETSPPGSQPGNAANAVSGS